MARGGGDHRHAGRPPRADGRPPASTNPAGLAVKAVAEQGDPGPFLRRLREAIFVERRRADRGDALIDVARETSPALDLATLDVAFGSHGPVEALGADFERAPAGRGRRSRSTARSSTGARPTPIGGRPSWPPGASPDGGGPLEIEDALRRFGACATAEIAALCDLPGPRAPAELWRLALEWRVRPKPVLGGELWTLA